MTKTKITCHLLIGVPASGKSTLSRDLANQHHAEVISTDRIRHDLFGSEATQGDWALIERVLHTRIKTTVASGRGVVIDATHSKPEHRKALLKGLKVKGVNLRWVGHHLHTPMTVCIERNGKRFRRVPLAVMQRMHNDLLQQPPTLDEGFSDLKHIYY